MLHDVVGRFVESEDPPLGPQFQLPQLRRSEGCPDKHTIAIGIRFEVRKQCGSIGGAALQVERRTNAVRRIGRCAGQLCWRIPLEQGRARLCGRHGPEPCCSGRPSLRDAAGAARRRGAPGLGAQAGSRCPVLDARTTEEGDGDLAQPRLSPRGGHARSPLTGGAAECAVASQAPRGLTPRSPHGRAPHFSNKGAAVTAGC
mmetsp:Transcript_43797/g.94347  ORF Transcript_43797/g.94347 Transcript_43797/m.94347 type:complete len:201 (-) Transcript_43797:948-1550(-)